MIKCIFVFIGFFSFLLISSATEIPLDLAGCYSLTLEITSKMSIPEKELNEMSDDHRKMLQSVSENEKIVIGYDVEITRVKSDTPFPLQISVVPKTNDIKAFSYQIIQEGKILDIANIIPADQQDILQIIALLNGSIFSYIITNEMLIDPNTTSIQPLRFANAKKMTLESENSKMEKVEIKREGEVLILSHKSLFDPKKDAAEVESELADMLPKVDCIFSANININPTKLLLESLESNFIQESSSFNATTKISLKRKK